jgi:hypothetical protein
MATLTAREVQALADALRLPMTAEDLVEVTHRLNAFLDGLADLGELALADAEPAPVPADALDPRPPARNAAP